MTTRNPLHNLYIFLQSRWELFLILIVFIICKIPHLYYPFYWDESWPYAPAIKQMYRHGPSLIPGSVDSLLSRGHPLFFHAAAASWMYIFGTTNMVMHSFALFTAVAFLIVIHEAVYNLFGRRAAVLSTVLVAVQVMYFVQASMLLIEIMVAFLAFLSLYLYVTRQYLLTALALSLLFYTKESGIVMGAVLGAHAFIQLFSKQQLRERLLRLLSVAIPFAAIAVFFLLQKRIFGWYVFPLYSDNLEHTWDSFYYKFRSTFFNVFALQYRYYYYLFLLGLCIVTVVVKRNIRYALLLLPAICIYVIIDDHRQEHISGYLMLSVLTILLLLANYTMATARYKGNSPQVLFIMLGSVFSIAFLAFSSVNLFLIYRYLFPVIILGLVCSGIYIDLMVTAIQPKLAYPVLATILLIAFFTFKQDEGHGDCNLGAFHAMHVQQKAVSYMESTGDYNASIGVGGFLLKVHLEDSNTGFLQKGKPFTDVDWRISSFTHYLIADNIEPSKGIDDWVHTDTSLHLVFQYAEGDTWTRVYKRLYLK